MDYGFALGSDRDKDRQDDRMRGQFQRRSTTTLINQRRITTLRSFIHHLNTANGSVRLGWLSIYAGLTLSGQGVPAINTPAGAIRVVAHHGNRGALPQSVEDQCLGGGRNAIAESVELSLGQFFTIGAPSWVLQPRSAGQPAGGEYESVPDRDSLLAHCARPTQIQQFPIE